MFFIDVFNTSGTKQGSGPIKSAYGWKSTNKMDGGGNFSFSMPSSDTKTSSIGIGYIVRCYSDVGGVLTEVGAGVVEQIETSPDDSGEVILTFTGGNLVEVLADTLVPPFDVFGSASVPLTHAQVVSQLQAYTSSLVTGAWTFVPDASPTVDTFYGQFADDSLLWAVTVAAKRAYTHFYYSGSNTLTFTDTFSDSGVRATQGKYDVAGRVCAIKSIQKIDDGFDIVNYLVPFGAGNAAARLNVTPRTKSLPSGITYEVRADGVTALMNTASQATYGLRARAIQWNDITPISSTTADVRAAADVLFDEAIRYLNQHSGPQEFYKLSIYQCPVLLKPMQSIRVVFRDAAQNINIDKALNILEATTEVDDDGVRTTELVVSTADRWMNSDESELVSRIVKGQLYQVHPQMNANSYVLPFTKNVDETETANFRFRFDTEVFQLTRATFDFQLLELESTVKNVGASSVTSSSGGATTTSSGGATTSGSGGATTSGSGGAQTSSSGGAQTSTAGGAQTSSSGGGQTSSSSGSHSHGVPDHQHRIGISQGSGGRNVGLFTGGGMYYEGADVGVVSIYTTSDSGSVTSNSGGSHSHTVDNHTHNVSDHTHNVSAHTHNVSDHTHSIASHTHTVAAHTHDVGAHTHTVTPTITTTYGIYRDSSANKFALSDLEYSMDTFIWYNFSVGVNGFTTLGDGWYRIDLTLLLQNQQTFRPLFSNNTLQIRRKSTGSTGKQATIEAQLNVRTIIQAIAST